MLLHSFKTRFGSRSGQGRVIGLEDQHELTKVNILIKKMVTIIVLKLNSQGDPMQD